jgi:uncharacterized protein (DUF1499 family)
VAVRARAVLLAVLAFSAAARGEEPVSRLQPCPPTPNCVSSKAQGKTHRVEPFPFAGSAAEALARVKAAALSFPRTKVVEEAPGYVHVTFTSAIFRFVDDVEFEVDEAAKVIHVRSASRVGRSDFGVNRKRVEAIRAKLGG